MQHTLDDYRNAVTGIGPLAGQWADKPHRLVYDLCRAIDNLRNAIRPLLDAGALEPGNHGNDRLLRVTDAELTAACEAYLCREIERLQQQIEDDERLEEKC